MSKITTFLTFNNGKAEEAMNFYVSLFDGSSVVSLERYGPSGPGLEGKVMHAVFRLNGQNYMCSDSAVRHNFSFTPAVSLLATCKTPEEVERLYAQLSSDGEVLMELGTHPSIGSRFAWVNDRFGVSWQLVQTKA